MNQMQYAYFNWADTGSLARTAADFNGNVWVSSYWGQNETMNPTIRKWDGSSWSDWGDGEYNNAEHGHKMPGGIAYRDNHMYLVRHLYSDADTGVKFASGGSKVLMHNVHEVDWYSGWTWPFDVRNNIAYYMDGVTGYLAKVDFSTGALTSIRPRSFEYDLAVDPTTGNLWTVDGQNLTEYSSTTGALLQRYEYGNLAPDYIDNPQAVAFDDVGLGYVWLNSSQATVPDLYGFIVRFTRNDLSSLETPWAWFDFSQPFGPIIDATGTDSFGLVAGVSGKVRRLPTISGGTGS